MSATMPLDWSVPFRTPSDAPSGLRSVRVAQPGTRGYRAIAELLREPPAAHTFEEVRAILGGEAIRDQRLAPFAEALAHAQARAVAPEWTQLGPAALRCPQGGSELRAWACVASELAPDPLRTTDLLVMATLADRAAWAERTGSGAFGSAVRDRRAAFVTEHGAACLSKLARLLESTSSPVLSTAGGALAALLAGEMP